MFKILIVEDDLNLNFLYSKTLKKKGYNVVQAYNGEEAIKIFEGNFIDLIITDILMPGINGDALTKYVREKNEEIPILIVTAKEDFDNKATCFNSGADDYLVKPVNLDELVLRVAALLRRSKINLEKKVTIGSTTLNYDSYTVTTGDTVIALPQKEFNILFKLFSYPDKIFTRNNLMDEFWGVDSESDIRTVDVHINRLREKFDNNPDFEIVTVRGLGYKVHKKEAN